MTRKGMWLAAWGLALVLAGMIGSVLEAGTGLEHGAVSSSHSSITRIPGDYLVTFER